MYRTIQDLIDAASFRAELEFIENKAVVPKRRGEELSIAMHNLVIVPETYVGQFVSRQMLDYLNMFNGIMEFKTNQEVPDVQGKEFYGYAMLHGYDYSHHGEPCVTGMLIEAAYLDEHASQLVADNEFLYKILKAEEDMQAPQCGHREGMENEDLPLEKKVFRIDLPKPVIDI